MTKRTPTLFVVSMVLGMALFHAARAHAFFSRLSAQTCWSTGPAFVNGSFVSSPTTNTANLYCPIPDNTSQPKNTITTVNVHGRTASGLPSAHLDIAECVVFYDQAGGDCDVGTDFGQPGVWTYSPSAGGVWRKTDASHTGAFPYVFVSLPQSGAGNNVSALFGIYVQ
jgi:hypothetical protein